MQPFLRSNALSPPVTLPGGLPMPTALSWLRRRGAPGAPASLLYKAFRQRQVSGALDSPPSPTSRTITSAGGPNTTCARACVRTWAQVRVFDGQRVVRVKEDRALAPGERLLFPLDLQRASAAAQGLRASARHATAPSWAAPPPPPAAPHSPPAPRPQSQHAAPGASAPPPRPGQPLPPQPEGRSAGGRAALQEAPAGEAGDGGRDGAVNPYVVSPGQPPGVVDASALSPGAVRRRVLAVTRHAVFVDKPAGVPVQVRPPRRARGVCCSGTFASCVLRPCEPVVGGSHPGC